MIFWTQRRACFWTLGSGCIINRITNSLPLKSAKQEIVLSQSLGPKMLSWQTCGTQCASQCETCPKLRVISDVSTTFQDQSSCILCLLASQPVAQKSQGLTTDNLTSHCMIGYELSHVIASHCQCVCLQKPTGHHCFWNSNKGRLSSLEEIMSVIEG